ncbi:pentapeptide repeat-containing protein [Aquimarina spongiae]|uniref:Uncharacterized protein YjbI, contains pentapeptide repeats n=1 Tax=Aquimarina spongiae TaxID=570521 RepID=A0A1M6B6L6_9FLAO|nr:pentapeptide repeat-containing protein [Aquimarina spongiae]SHI44355.1 Uncharacterized protein YjbI, contains pentapeptide repeats [Aquimarina spongiae]
MNKDKRSSEAIELEAKLIRQEHRLIALLRNFFIHRNRTWKKGDPRNKAARNAFFWGLFFSPTTVSIVFTGGILSLFTVYLMNKQNKLLQSQNKLIQYQNMRISQQTHLFEAERVSSLVFLFNNIMDKIDEELKNPENISRQLSDQLCARIISLSRRLKPYKQLNIEKGILDKKMYSPERGQLLINLIEAKLNQETYIKIFKKSDFSYSHLPNYNFGDYTFIKGINLSNSNLQSIVIDNSDLSEGNFSYSNMSNAKIKNCDLSLTSFKGTNLFGSTIDQINFDYLNKKYKNDSVSDSFDRMVYILEKNVNTPDKRQFISIVLDDANLINAQFNNIKFDDASFICTNLNGAILQKVNFDECQMSNANFLNAKLERVNFIESNLSNSSFGDIAYNNIVRFKNSDLRNAVFEPGKIKFSAQLFINRRGFINYNLFSGKKTNLTDTKLPKTIPLALYQTDFDAKKINYRLERENFITTKPIFELMDKDTTKKRGVYIQLTRKLGDSTISYWDDHYFNYEKDTFGHKLSNYFNDLTPENIKKIKAQYKVKSNDIPFKNKAFKDKKVGVKMVWLVEKNE